MVEDEGKRDFLRKAAGAAAALLGTGLLVQVGLPTDFTKSELIERLRKAEENCERGMLVQEDFSAVLVAIKYLVEKV